MAQPARTVHDALLFECAWEVANKGEHMISRAGLAALAVEKGKLSEQVRQPSSRAALARLGLRLSPVMCGSQSS